MHISRISLLGVSLALTAGLFTSQTPLAQEKDIQTIYATEKGACGRGPEMRIEFTQGRITSKGFDCALGEYRPAGTGLVAYEASCVIDGKKNTEGIALDLGNYSDHFELSLPGRDDWLKLYPCTKVRGLNQVNTAASPTKGRESYGIFATGQRYGRQSLTTTTEPFPFCPRCVVT